MAQHPELQVVTYHWSEADNSMICPSVTKSNRQDYPASAITSVSIGALNRLPLEVIHNLLGHLDISTIGTVRCLSRSFRLLVDSFPMYRDPTIYASSVLCVLYSTHLASTYSIEELYNVLTNDRCICCDSFGLYLSLITCERCCFSCLYNPKMAPTTLSAAAYTFGLSKNEIMKKVPVVTTLPGTYIIERTARKKILKVVSVRKALALALAKQNKTQLEGDDLTNLNEKAKALIRHYNDPIRFMIATPIPYLNTRDHHTEAGVWCPGCELVWYRSSGRKRFEESSRTVLNTAYSEKEYRGHFEECEAAKELWELFVRDGKGLEHLYRGRHREWASRSVESQVFFINSEAKSL